MTSLSFIFVLIPPMDNGCSQRDVPPSWGKVLSVGPPHRQPPLNVGWFRCADDFPASWQPRSCFIIAFIAAPPSTSTASVLEPVAGLL